MTFQEKLLKHLNIDEKYYEELTKDVTEEDLPPYTCFDNVDAIITRIKKAIDNKEKIIVYGDYDCDGVMATSILVKAFNMIGYPIKYYIPSRYQDGYGLNEKNVELMAKSGYSLIITVDNGISALEAISLAKEKGIDVIVTDHHEQIRDLPDTPYIMHPTISHYGEVYCCGAYVSYMLATALLGRHDNYLLCLAAIATVSDMMSLTSYNRTILRIALYYINKYKYINVINLISKDDEIVDENTIGLEIAPKVNAVGRMKEDVASMQRVVRYFVSDNLTDIKELGNWITSINTERKELIVNAVNNLSYNHDTPSIIVVTEEKEGLIGLLANKLMNDNNKPAIAFCRSTEDPTILKGSARSKEGFSIAKAFDDLKDLEVVYGGHALAGGLSIKEENLQEFIIKFNELALAHPFIETKDNTLEIELTDINKDNYRFYETLKPFGMGFDRPLFKISHISTESLGYVSANKHICTKITNSSKILGFNMPKIEVDKYKYINIYGYLDHSFFRGFETINLKLTKFFNSEENN